MTLLTYILFLVAALLSLFTGGYFIWLLQRDLPEEIDLKKHRKNHIKRMLFYTGGLFVLFLVADAYLEDLPPSEYFNWNKEGMHVFMFFMLLSQCVVNIQSIWSIEIPNNIKKQLIAGYVIIFCSMVILLGIFVNLLIYA